MALKDVEWDVLEASDDDLDGKTVFSWNPQRKKPRGSPTHARALANSLSIVDHVLLRAFKQLDCLSNLVREEVVV